MVGVENMTTFLAYLVDITERERETDEVTQCQSITKQQTRERGALDTTGSTHNTDNNRQ